jgi:tartrate-resistant acid phosphatase type 5
VKPCLLRKSSLLLSEIDATVVLPMIPFSDKQFSRFVVFLCGILNLSAMASDRVVIGAIADYGTTGSASIEVAKLVKRWSPDMIITLGDNNYGDASDYDFIVGQFYHEFIHPYAGSYGSGATSNRFFPSIGNHDYFGSVTAFQPYLDYFTLPGNERYYTFQQGPVSFFVLHSNPEEPDGRTNGSVQAQWLQSQLNASTSAWNIVYFHHAPFSSGLFYAPGDQQMRWPFAQWGASVVICGHDHIYERVYAEHLVYLVNGLGGATPYPLSTTPTTGSQTRFNTAHGALRLDVSATNLTFAFITTNDFVVDTITLTNAYRSAGFVTAPEGQVVLLGRTATFNSFVTGTRTPFDYQWFFNSSPIINATNRILNVTNATLANEGTYRVTASNEHAVLSASAQLAIARQPHITAHPTNATAVGGSNISFRVQAQGAGNLRYQWTFNGLAINDATNSSLVLTNVQRSMEGLYAVAVTDDFGTALSSDASLRVLLLPVFLVPPVEQTVLPGQTAVFSYALTGDFPMRVTVTGHRIATQTHDILDSSVQFLSVSAPAPPPVGILLAVRNVAGQTFRNTQLVVDGDHDSDGAGDAWELKYGFDPNVPDDGGLDTDRDGASNRQEFGAGTDPTDTNSVLRARSSLIGLNEVQVQFEAISNRTYSVQATDELTASIWRNIAQIWATTVNRDIRVTNSIGPGTTFYRVVTPRVP